MGMELLPCPFCGASDGRLVQAFTRATDDFAYWSVECLDCACEIVSDASQDEADAAWNTRASLSPERDGEMREGLAEVDLVIAEMIEVATGRDDDYDRGVIDVWQSRLQHASGHRHGFPSRQPARERAFDIDLIAKAIQDCPGSIGFSYEGWCRKAAEAVSTALLSHTEGKGS